MNKMRNFIYDKNDILVALLIVIIAAIVILNRVDTIMAYPTETAAKVTQPSGEKNAQAKDTNNTKKPTETAAKGNTPTDSKDKTTPANASKETPSKGVNFSVYIAYGSTPGSVADDLLKAGLIKTKEEFLQAITAAGADSKLQAGNFIIPSGSTPEQIVAIVTK